MLLLANLCAVPLALGLTSAPSEPLFPGLGTHHHRITTSSALAQRYFDQGMMFMDGFNHDEAISSFRQAAALDPNCAMAYWGVALSYGPNINYPFVDPDHAKGAWDALQKAQALEKGGSPEERDLIDALGKRYANPQPDDRSGLDKAYAAAMRQVWQKYPKDPDVGALFAESMMDLRPWDLWSLDGKPRDITPEIVATLQRVIALDPDNPQGLHLYIHTMEASPTPWKALDAANKLRTLLPGLGHMVHMPSHIYIRVGRWRDAEAANFKAIAVDSAYRKLRGKNIGFYRAYMTHNYHMLTFAAMMSGQDDLAIRSMDKGVAIIPADWAKANAPYIDAFMAMPFEVRKRFGRWKEILNAPDLPEYFPIARAMRHADRGIAFSALGQSDEANAEVAYFDQARKAVPAGATFGNSPANSILDIAEHLLKGEVLLAEHKSNDALVELRQAVKSEDELPYDEPPDWIQPTRHTLGAALIQAGRFEEAAAVYKRDLQIHPHNGWSLFGLWKAYQGLGKGTEASVARHQFLVAWKGADTQIGSSCLCIPGSMNPH